MRIVFMGTPDFASESLKALVQGGHKVELVITNPDKPKGRGMQVESPEVKREARIHGLDVIQPEKVRNNGELVQKLKNINPDVICVVAYGKIIPKEILEIPKYGCINVHASLLPKYRGAAPIQWAIINGEKKTGVTTMFMDEGMDTGDIILKDEVPIRDDETSEELWKVLTLRGASLLLKTLKYIEDEDGNIKREKQGEDFTLAPMLKKEIAKIDWNIKTSIEIRNLVRGLTPFMGVYCFLDGKKLKFWKVKCIDEKVDEEPGTVLKANSKEGLFIATKDGIISVEEIQAENAKKMNICDYLRGNHILVGTKFE